MLAALVARAVERGHARVIHLRVYALARLFPSSTRWFMDAFTPKPKSLPARSAE